MFPWIIFLAGQTDEHYSHKKFVSMFVKKRTIFSPFCHNQIESEVKEMDNDTRFVLEDQIVFWKQSKTL